MKPETVTELRAAIEGNAQKYQTKCLVRFAIPLLHVVSSARTRMDVSLKTGVDKTIMFVDSIKF